MPDTEKWILQPVTPELHAKLKSAAALEQKTLKEYIRETLEDKVEEELVKK